MKGFIFGIIVTVLAIILGGYLVITRALVPMGQDNEPGRLEIWIAKTSLKATLIRESRGLSSPLAPTEETLAAGISLYRTQCQSCHGGADGMPSSIARGLTPAAPQLARHGVEDDPEATIYWKIKHGIRFTGMPGFGKSLSDREIWQIALFLKHMKDLPPAARQTWTAGR